jgi:deoxyribose-phosphate aldolase
MPLPKSLHQHAAMMSRLEQFRQELHQGALRGATNCGFPQKTERATAAMMALIYAAKLVAEEADMVEMYHAMLAAEVPAHRAGRIEVQ